MKRKFSSLAIAMLAAATLAGCYIPGQTTTAPPDQAAAEKADQALKELEGKVLSKGPNGEEPSPATSAELTPEQLAKIKDMKATAAIVMHYAGNDWSTAQIAGLRSEFGNLGIEVVAVTDANFKPDKQVSDIETVMSKKPDIIVSLPTDPVATAQAYRGGAAGGAKLVFMDNVPKGFKAGTDYVSAVSADNFGNGVVVGASDGQGARCQGQDRTDLPRGRLLRHPPALRRLQADHSERLPGDPDRRGARASPARTSPATRRVSRTPC